MADDVQPNHTESEKESSWEQLLKVTKRCQDLFTEVRKAVKDGRILPQIGLTLLQHHLMQNTVDAHTVIHLLETRLKLIAKRKIGIILAGEVSVGKTTIANVLMGGNYLPTSRGQTTRLVCELHHDLHPKAILKFEEKHNDDETISLSVNAGDGNWEKVREIIKTKEYQTKALDKIIIFWRFLFLQDIKQDGMTGGNDITSMNMMKPATNQKLTPEIPYSRRMDSPPASSSVSPENTGYGCYKEDSDNTLRKEPCTSSCDPTEDRFQQSLMSDVCNDVLDVEVAGEGFSFAFLDCPGIFDKQNVQPVLRNLSTCRSLIFAIDIHNASDQRKLQVLMEDIEKSLIEQNITLNPDTALFIINKTDLISNDEIADEKEKILRQLQMKWPLIKNGHLVMLHAKKLLNDDPQVSGNDRTALYKTLISHIKRTIRLTLEEHCLWLLNMLESAHAVARKGKRWSEHSKAHSKMKTVLIDSRLTCLALQSSLSDIRDTDIIKEAVNKLKDVVTEQYESDRCSITWTEDEIKAKMNNDELGWMHIIETVDQMICEKIAGNMERQVEKIRKEYNYETKQRYKYIIHGITKLQKQIQDILQQDNMTGMGEGAFEIFASATLIGAVRLTPVMYPFVFFAAPVLSIPLVILSMFEEYKGYKEEGMRTRFKEDKCLFFEQRTKFILEKSKATVSTEAQSVLFKHIFGENPKQILNEHVEKLFDDIEFLLSSSSKVSEAHQQYLKEYTLRTLQFYSEEIMDHDIDATQLEWLYNKQGIRSLVGLGGEACIYEADMKKTSGTSISVAVKEFRFIQNDENNSSFPSNIDIYRQCVILRQLSRKQNPNLAKFYGSNFYRQDNEICLRLVLERCIGNLDMIIKLNKTVVQGPVQAQHRFLYYAKECTKGLNFLHDNNVLHRDVKPSNFLLRKEDGRDEYRVVISDMGCSQKEDKIITEGRRHGTPVYWSPEIISGRSLHSKASDVYSLGLVFWELWFHKKVSKSCIELMKTLPDDENAKKLVLMCLKMDQKKRKSTSELLQYFNNLN